MSSRVLRPVILDKDTDEEAVKRIKEMMRRHLDDYLDLVEKHPKLIEEWKASPAMNEHSQRDSEDDCAEAARIRRAAYGHFMSRHPQATLREVSQAFSAYTCLISGFWVEHS
jgi:hypothetical protein